MKLLHKHFVVTAQDKAEGAYVVKVCAQLLTRMISKGYSQKQVFGKAKPFGKVQGRRHSAVAVTQRGTLWPRSSRR